MFCNNLIYKIYVKAYPSDVNLRIPYLFIQYERVVITK